MLATYLRDHLSGAAAGLALAGRCRRENATNDIGATLGIIEEELAAERSELIDIMRRLDVSPNRLKMFIARTAELLGRLKTNGSIARYSPSSLVLELEGLLGGVTAKRGLWMSLLAASTSRTELDAIALQRLITQATSQLERLAAAHEDAAQLAFGALPTLSSHPSTDL